MDKIYSDIDTIIHENELISRFINNPKLLNSYSIEGLESCPMRYWLTMIITNSKNKDEYIKKMYGGNDIKYFFKIIGEKIPIDYTEYDDSKGLLIYPLTKN